MTPYTLVTRGQSPISRYPAFMRALSIRQPYAEEILRGIKKVEYGSTELAEVRNRRTTIIGKRFYIYAAKARGQRAEVRTAGT